MKLTKLTLALVAVLAMSAMMASAASANYQSSSSPVDLSGSQNGKHAFKVDGQAVECNVANFARKALSTPASEVQNIVANYANCTAFGFANASVTMGTCTYNFDTVNGIWNFNANIDIACTSNANDNEGVNTGDARIFSSVFGSECEVHVESQNNKSELTFLNNTPVSGDVRVVAAVTGLTAQISKDNGVCPLAGTGVTNTATYNGNTDVTGDSSINLTVN
ncbi:MAG TPA: hypothetical protein VFU16_09685 [Solirubrobacterales bacterium]|nr:hypothetical protein [Solirubrobacterales bacterium]